MPGRGKGGPKPNPRLMLVRNTGTVAERKRAKESLKQLEQAKVRRERGKSGDEVAPWLGKIGRAWFERLADAMEELGTYAPQFDPVLGLAAGKFEEVERLAAVIAEKGETYESETKDGSAMVRARPEVQMLEKAQRHSQSLLAECGLTPTTFAKAGKPGK